MSHGQMREESPQFHPGYPLPDWVASKIHKENGAPSKEIVCDVASSFDRDTRASRSELASGPGKRTPGEINGRLAGFQPKLLPSRIKPVNTAYNRLAMTKLARTVSLFGVAALVVSLSATQSLALPPTG